MNKYKLNVGIIGLGTVGSGVIKLLKKQKEEEKYKKNSIMIIILHQKLLKEI